MARINSHSHSFRNSQSILLEESYSYSPRPCKVTALVITESAHLKGEGTVGTNTTCSFTKLPEREDPGEETEGDPDGERLSVGDPGGERLSVGDENLVTREEADKDLGGDSPSMGEKDLRGAVREEPESDPSSLAASRFGRREPLLLPSELCRKSS